MLIAYASGAANPTQSQSDFIVDLQGGDTLPATAQLYGGGSDSSDPSATFTFSWSLLKRPPTSNAALNDNALQNPILGAVDVWGNYRLFLIVTNTATGASSETDPLAAPSSAFVSVRVQSAELGIEKPSAGERDWNSKAWAWVDAIEDHEARVDTLETLGLDDLTDVTLGTLTGGEALVYDGANWSNTSILTSLDGLTDVSLTSLTSGESLVYNGANWSNDTLTYELSDLTNVTLTTPASGQGLEYNGANWVNTAQPIITEADRASATDYGIVRVEAASTSYNTQARILDVERLMFTALVDGMVDYKSATQHHKTGDGDVEIDAPDPANIAQDAALIFRNVTGEEIVISDIALVMASSGISTTTDYAFSFVVYTNLTNLAGNTAATTYALPTYQRIGDNKAGACDFNYVTHNGGTPLSVAAGAYFGILVTSVPDSYLGNRLQCTMQAFRLIS